MGVSPCLLPVIKQVLGQISRPLVLPPHPQRAQRWQKLPKFTPSPQLMSGAWWEKQDWGALGAHLN